MNDISEQIVQIRKLINQLEMLNANPALIGKQQLYDKAVELDIIVQNIIMKVADYA
jgi:hypothetical protein